MRGNSSLPQRDPSQRESGRLGAQGSYGTAEISEEGIDLSRLRADLKLTPGERILKAAALSRFVLKLQASVTKAKRKP